MHSEPAWEEQTRKKCVHQEEILIKDLGRVQENKACILVISEHAVLQCAMQNCGEMRKLITSHQRNGRPNRPVGRLTGGLVGWEKVDQTVITTEIPGFPNLSINHQMRKSLTIKSS